MTSFNYTKGFTVSSSVIDSVWFNENDNTVVLDVNDWLFRYSGVTGQDVSLLVRGGSDGSVGGHYNKVFKPEFGPAEALGYYDDVAPEQVPVEKDQSVPTTPKDMTYAGAVNSLRERSQEYLSAPTREFSLGSAPDHSVSDSPVSVNDEEPTREFSLAALPDVGLDDDLDDDVSVVVHFTLDGFDRKYKYRASADNVEDAIAELHEYVSNIGARGRVRKVVVKFD